MILIVCAVEKELAFWTPVHGAETLVTGVGPVEAACSVTHALSQRRYRLVVNAGIAGAFKGAAEIGEGVAVAVDRMDVALETGERLTLPDDAATIEHAGSDPRLLAALSARGFKILRGITVSRVTATNATAQRLQASGAQVESMEGFAVLRAAEKAGIPAIEVRGISNVVGDRADSGWDFAAGVRGLESVLDALLEGVDLTAS
ncbi:MAG: futalosine hydrolase [Vulcanimicrobiaceae bacterium]